MTETEVIKVCVSLNDYADLVRQLATLLYQQQNFQVQQVVAVARGGLFPAEVISRCFGAPMATISAGSYPDVATRQERVIFSRDLTTSKPLVRTGILVVDELTESGLTLQETVSWLVAWYGLSRDEIRTAVLWHKTKSCHTPDFYVELVGPDSTTGSFPWFVTPQEQSNLWLPTPRP